MLEVFFRYYLELVFEHFPQDIMCRIMEFLRQGLIFSNQQDIVSDSCNMLDQFNQLCVKSIENSKAQNIIQTPGQQKCVEFLNSQGQIVISLFQTLIFTTMFEHHTNMWVY